MKAGKLALCFRDGGFDESINRKSPDLNAPASFLSEPPPEIRAVLTGFFY
jgi:hypothetical protein